MPFLSVIPLPEWRCFTCDWVYYCLSFTMHEYK